MLHFSARGEDEDAGRAGGFAQFSEHAETVEAGEIQIQYDEVGRIMEGRLQSQRAIVLRLGLMPVALERPRDVAGEFRFVFDDEDAHGAADTITAHGAQFLIARTAQGAGGVMGLKR